jgi:hypothetical protein
MPKLCQDLLGNVSKSSWRPFEKYLKGIGDSLGNSKRVLETFSATFTEYQIHFGKCPNRSGDPLGAFPNVSLANRKQGYPLVLLPSVSPHISDMFWWFLRRRAVLLNLIKNWRHDRKNWIMISGSSPIFNLSNHTTFAKLKLVRRSLL